MKKFIVCSKYNDDRERKIASILQGIVLLVLAFFLLLLSINQWAHVNRGVFISSVPIFASFWLIRRGYLRGAIFGVALTLLGMVTYISTSGQGIHDIGNLAYPGILVISSLILHKRHFLMLTLFTIGAIAWLVFGSLSGGYTPSPYERSDAWTDFLVVTVILLITAISAYLLAENMQRSLARAQQEIAERQRTEDALQLSEERYRQITELMSDYAYAYRVEPDGSFTMEWITTESALRMTGYDPSREIRSSLLLYHPDDQPQVQQDLQRTLAGQPTSADYRIMTKQGEVRWVHIERHPVWDTAHTRVIRFFGVAQDITTRKQIEEERERLIAELEVKNAELERFTYTVSHDLKSPLVTVKGFLGFLEQDAIKGNMERLRRDIQHIRQATDTMQQLLNELLELSRIGRLMNPAQDMEFTGLVQDVLTQMEERIAKRGIQVIVNPCCARVYGDRLRLREVMQNLMENAMKFMGEQPEPTIEIGVREGNNERIFYVADNGIGIEPRYQEKVFGLFERLNPSIEGTGVGLALVKRIIEVHGGKIWIESEGIGHGSTFYFTLADRQGEHYGTTEAPERGASRDFAG